MNLVNSYLFLCLISAVKCFSIFGHKNGIHYLFKEFNKTTTIFDSSTVETKWIEQPIDHFNETDNRKWKMSYFQRLDMWKSGGPIYLHIDEGAGDFDQNKGLTYELAKETNGATFVSGRRFYYENQPFEDFSIENLRYLSSRQALADIARLIENLKKRPDFAESKVVVVGEFNNGNLAAWFKLLYPDLADATIACRSSVEAKTDFYEYFEAVGDDYKKYGLPGCYEKIQQLFEELEIKFQTNNGIEELKKQLNICPGTNLTIVENKQDFFHSISSYFAFYEHVYNIKQNCKVVQGNLRTFLNDIKNKFTRNNMIPCVSYDFEYNVIQSRNELQSDPWFYQICTEFGYFHTTSSNYQPFMKNVPIDYYIKLCQGILGKEFDAKRVEEGVKKTNEMYGGLNLNVSKVVFVIGELDPIRRLSILKDISSEAPAIVIPKLGRYHISVPEHRGDIQELKEARKHIKKLIKKWIGAEE